MGPFMRIKNTTTRMMVNVIVALIPIILFTFYKNGVVPYQKGYTDIYGMLYPVIFILISVTGTFMIETIYDVIFNKNKNSFKKIISTSYAYMPGLFLALVLPINTPIPILLMGCLVASIIGKALFGGFGQNIFNPALLGCLFIISAYALNISNNGGYLNSYELDTVSSATPLSHLSTLTGIGTYDTVVKPYGNLWTFFLGMKPGAVGETSILLCLIGFIYLTLTKTIKWRIPTVYVSTVFVMTLLIGLYNNLGIWYPLFEIFSGGLMFGAIFMSTDPVTSPVTSKGQILYGLCLGLLTVIFRYLTSYPEGVLTAILTMNMLVFILDKIGYKSKDKISKFFIPFTIILILIFMTVYGISSKYKGIDTTKDTNFDIVDVAIENSNVTYTVTEKGYTSVIKLKIVINKGIIKSAEILEAGDSFFSKVTDANYIDKLIKEQKTIANCDTVSGATISSTAVKKAFINTLDDYNNGGYKTFKKGSSTSTSTDTTKTSSDFKINSKTDLNGSILYNVDEKSFNGNMNLEITVTEGKVTNINIISYHDTCVSSSNKSEYYTCPEYMEDGFVARIIADNNTDTVSGATISSTAIKTSVQNVLKDYQENLKSN